MKKNAKILSKSLLGLMIWGGISCTTSFDEEIPLVLASSGVEVIQGTLKVNSFDKYEDLITGKEKLYIRDFNSFQKGFDELEQSVENLRISQEEYNEITAWEGSTLLELLDQDGFIILEEYLIYLNFNNRIAVVSTDLNLKDEILAGDISSESIRLFKFEDDVIGLLEINSPSTVEKGIYRARILTTFDPLAYTVINGCVWDKCDNSTTFGNSANTGGDIIGLGFSGGTFRYRLDAKHVYQNAAISFRLLSEAKHMRKPEDGSVFWKAQSTSLYFWYDFEYLSKKNGSTLKKKASVKNDYTNDLDTTFYSSSRGLDKFYLRTQFYGEPGGNHGYSPNGTYWQFNLKQISKGY
ncbi:hypothetical protein Aoki45_29710 [Algoriphagus sp. oki45]|uniref:hypothetical protein n=1 Tax=Algoriphagus sp. oki45 TaxID=3067294 RepID=UPI0027FBD864|nr:hypothetical protein Aoki45_29710 [Algoriphagus sp. oki45]